ncbi:MAG: PaREP1 family protein [Candidatus Baldrarchaeia archaeon]
MLGISVPKVVFEELRRRAERNGRSIEEMLTDLVIKEVDPESRAEKYIEAARELLEWAENELKRENLRQASEKIWNAAALAVKAYAFWKEKKVLTRHVELWQYKSILAGELGDWVRDSWLIADSMHKNFYENEADRNDVARALQHVKKLVEAVWRKIKH